MNQEKKTIKLCKECGYEINQDEVPLDSKLCLTCIQVEELITSTKNDDPILFTEGIQDETTEI